MRSILYSPPAGGLRPELGCLGDRFSGRDFYQALLRLEDISRRKASPGHILSTQYFSWVANVMFEEAWDSTTLRF